MNLNDFTSTGQLSFVGRHSNGFRLHKLEVYNWGTFDGKIWAFAPNGDTTLLTGDSGSGKSTLVDALVTLFVSPRKIAYNKAADASARERSLFSYVRGHYGQKYAYEGKGAPEALRDSAQYSVLLATLADPAFDKTITLAAFFWFREQQGNPSRFYAVAQRELFVGRDFSDFHGDIRQLKAALKAAGSEVFDDYNHYAECYRKILGNLSPQAIELFQQTISMKKVEALTDFVRSNMLEETDIMEDIDKLIQHYYSLNSAYEAVQRARRQAQFLEPICSNGRQYAKQLDEMDEMSNGQKAFEHWFATLKADLCKERVAQLEGAQAAAKITLANEQKLLYALEAEIKRLEQEIYQNGGGALENLREELKRMREALSRKEKDRGRYSEHADRLGLGLPDSPAVFAENLQRAEALRRQLPQEKAIAEQRLSGVSAKLELEKNSKNDIEDEIASLKGRTSNIPKELIALRQRMCAALSMRETHLPFAGELLEVKDSELAWEGAIERLLHNFALSVLVSEDCYAAVAKWVNEQHLGARLVYFAVKDRGGEPPRAHPDTVAGKLAVKPQTPFTEWLARELSERFQHACCRDIAAFRSEKRAITLTGQIKSAARHEKDDRKRLTDRAWYVLGFSNQKKIEALASDSARLKERISRTEAENKAALDSLAALSARENALNALRGFADFSELDVQGAQRECMACAQTIEKLSKEENNALSVLRGQLETANAKKKRQNEKVDSAKEKESKINWDLSDVKEKQRANRAVLETESPLEKLSYPYLEKNRPRWLGTTALTLENSANQERRCRDSLHRERERLQSSISELKISIEKGIVEFRHQFPAETQETDDTVKSLPDYHRMLNQLLKDDLPKYESKFKELLTSQVLHRIALFQVTLKQHYEKVKTRIEAINSSMHGIDYNPSRYIKLNCEDNPDAEIRMFRAKLKSCTEGATDGFSDENLATARFLQIKELIERFQGREKETEADKRWTRKVADVRNWFLFSASERWRETDDEYEHYTDSGGKSGGQKEKLAYTILAASLVYNYGLHEDYIDQSSFRLVVIDEAFLKSSDDSARYGLKLFEQLKFQLVIVTPLLKISTIEPFIAHVGFVSHDDVAHKSSLINISIEVYKEKRRAWEALQYA
jgi:uncharacterized protein YPO0396